MHTRYDVELYQRIEQLIGKKLPLHATVEEEVMSLMERVSEAQRYAKMVRKPNFQDIIVGAYHNIISNILHFTRYPGPSRFGRVG